ncbi:MAG: hypothetical protein C4K47_08775 [Candidatus Thorarchaeota archaeon]|nr:MAG: hypothetical protein C4K47_08775 [Candidatus Thorarchaeota archaeon]
MSTPSGRYACAAIGFSLLLPVIIAFIVLEALGVAEYALPIMMPIFLAMLVVFGVVGLGVLAISRWAQNAELQTRDGLVTPEDQQIADGLSSAYMRTKGGHFMIPTHCPHCGNAIDLQRVDWSSSRTLTCPACYHEIDVKTV